MAPARTWLTRIGTVGDFGMGEVKRTGGGLTTEWGGDDIVAAPDDALGTLMDGADRVTRDPDDAKGFETVVYRGYDSDGELMTSVVVEGSDTNWRVSQVDTCE